jgi:hypothetical protein
MLRIISMFFFLLIGTGAFAAELTEQQKITALLNAFDTPGVIFIRNGESHDGAWAKQHLQDKMKEAKPKITTAKDFITKIASHSSHTDKPYIIKLDTGKEVESGKWLDQKLSEIEKSSGGEK